MRIAISSGHGKHIQGADDVLNEVDEARRVVHQVVEQLRGLGVTVSEFHDNTSTTQSQNLTAIVDWHNSQERDLDVSVHFNAYEHTVDPMGTECLYLTQYDLADAIAIAIAAAGGLINRGPKKRTDLKFLNSTEEPAVLIEVCFVDSVDDCDHYGEFFKDICEAIAGALIGQRIEAPPEVATAFPVRFEGTCSWFGGPDDTGVAADEGLAFFYEVDDAPHLFLPDQPPGTTGLARRLDPARPYVACRWDYDVTPKEMLREMYPALVRNTFTDEWCLAWPADWGPHEEKTGRAADLSPAVMERLDLSTDDEVEVIYPAPMPIRRDFV